MYPWAPKPYRPHDMAEHLLDFPFAAGWWVVLLLAWTYLWKGMALWKAAQKSSKWWFIALLFINTFGILEILYLYVFSEHKMRPKHVAHEHHEHEKPADPASV